MKKLRIAVVGLGYWGPNVLRNILNIPEAEVTYACDLSSENLQKTNALYPGIAITKKIGSVLKSKDVDAVAIATPLHTHYTLTKQALLAGKHVLVEKPFTENTSDAIELKNLAKKKGLTLMVGHTFVYAEAVKKLDAIIKGNQLGKMFYYDSTRINLGRLQPDSDVISDLAVHDFSILNFIIQEKPVAVKAVGAAYVGKKHIENAHIFLYYPDNFSAHIHVGWLSPVKIRKIIIAGDKQMVLYDDIEPSEKLRVYDKNVSLPKNNITPFKPAYRSGDVIIPHIKQQEALFAEVSHFVYCVMHRKNPLTDANAAIHVMKMLEASEEALRTQKEVNINW